MATMVSVIIPVYNNPSGLLDTLKSLVVQDYKDFEIIVADNGSTDNTLKTAEDFAKGFPEIIMIVTENNIQSSYAARNKGIEASRGSIIAFIDADMTVEKDWLRKIVEVFNKNTNIDYLGCKVDVCLNSKNIFELFNKIFGFPIERCVTYNNFALTCCLVARKALFDKVGLFDNRLISGGDYEFGNRVFEARYKLYYEPKIVMKHPARFTLIQFLKKYFRIGRGQLQLFFYYPLLYSKVYKSILNPLNFFPPKPWKFLKEYKSNIVIKENFLSFYLLCWLLKITNLAGRLYELLNMKVKKVR